MNSKLLLPYRHVLHALYPTEPTAVSLWATMRITDTTTCHLLFRFGVPVAAVIFISRRYSVPSVIAAFEAGVFLEFSRGRPVKPDNSAG